MATREVKIRRYQPVDEKEAKFSVAKAAMEPLAVANRRAYIHPITLAAWGAISALIVEYMKLWPTPVHGVMGYLAPVPIMAATWVPVMFLVDWLHREAFEKQAKKVVHGPDMTDIVSYYTRSPSSGFWILEYGDIFVGLVALDASRDSLADGKATSLKGTTQEATIRHFYIDEVYRGSGIQSDLLNHAVRLAFEGNKQLQKIRALDTQLLPYIQPALQEAGFEYAENVRKEGIFGWKVDTMTLNRKNWERAQPEQRTFKI